MDDVLNMFQLSQSVATVVNAHFFFYSQMFELQGSFGYFWPFPGYITGDKGDWNFSSLIFLKKVKFRVIIRDNLYVYFQTAQTLTKAFEQFVKPEQLDGDNAYKCSK